MKQPTAYMLAITARDLAEITRHKCAELSQALQGPGELPLAAARLYNDAVLIHAELSDIVRAIVAEND